MVKKRTDIINQCEVVDSQKLKIDFNFKKLQWILFKSGLLRRRNISTNVNSQQKSLPIKPSTHSPHNGRSHAYDKLLLIKEIKNHPHDGTDIV